MERGHRMPNRGRGLALVGILFAGSMAPLELRPSVVYAQALPTRGGVFTIHLESDEVTYHLGEPIKVRISVHNNTAALYRVNAGPPWGLCDLEITRNGVKLSRTNLRYGYRWESNYIGDYKPGSTHVIEFMEPANPPTIGQWARVLYWGYDLRTPGSYTITVVPQIRAFPRAGPGQGGYFVTSSSDKSNTVHITIIN
jgi:hypothetical protein